MLRFAPAATGLVVEINRARLHLNLLADQVARSIVLRRPTPDQMPERYRRLKVADSLAVSDFIGKIKGEGLYIDGPTVLRVLHQHAGLRLRQAVADSRFDNRALLRRRLKGRAATTALRGRLARSRRRGGLGRYLLFCFARSHGAYLALASANFKRRYSTRRPTSSA
jgi:hypothetical protein